MLKLALSWPHPLQRSHRRLCGVLFSAPCVFLFRHLTRFPVAVVPTDADLVLATRYNGTTVVFAGYFFSARCVLSFLAGKPHKQSHRIENKSNEDYCIMVSPRPTNSKLVDEVASRWQTAPLTTMPTSTSRKNLVAAADERFSQFDPLRASFAHRCVDLVVRLAKSLGQEELSQALAAPTPAETLLIALSSPNAINVVDDPLAAARIRGARGRAELLAQEGGMISATEASTILGLSRQGVDKRRRGNKLLALEGGRRGYQYPLWQFMNGTVLPGLDQVLGILAEHPPLTQMQFFLAGNHRLGKERPLDRLRNGDIETVKRAASAFRIHGAP